jgi:hypothetical protein
VNLSVGSLLYDEPEVPLDSENLSR